MNNYKYQQAMKAYNTYHNMLSEDKLRQILLLIGSIK